MINAKEAHELYEKNLPDEEIQNGKLETLDTIVRKRCESLERFILVDSNYFNHKTQNYLTVLGFTLMFARQDGKRFLRISW